MSAHTDIMGYMDPQRPIHGPLKRIYVIGRQTAPGLPCPPLPNGAPGCLFFGQTNLLKQYQGLSLKLWNQTSFLRSVELARHLQGTVRGCKVNPGTSNRINP